MVFMPDIPAQSPLANSPIEIIRDDFHGRSFRAAIFDFDGTLSLLRRNWQDVMIPMMVDILVATGSGERRDELGELVEEFVMQLNGRQTIYQMIQLADEVRQRGRTPLDPLDYKQQYHDLLWRQIGQRVEAVRKGKVAAETMTVPGSHQLLTRLCNLGVRLYLASGTDLTYVADEVTVLGLDQFFETRIYGALDDYKQFSKALVIQHMIAEAGFSPDQIVGFGDGFVEIEEIKRVGGTAVGVASDETTRAGVDVWKRDRLIRAGADIIIGDYRQQNELIARLGFA
jgi:beta-phosphoglucomutase-like phosphatase (HAD superfamily)